MHLFHNVAPAHKFSFNVNLWDGWPIRELFDCGSQGLICQHIHVFVLLDAVCVQKYDHIPTEAALGHLPCALHEHTDIVLFDPCRDVLGHLVGRLRLRLRLEVIVAVFVSSTRSVIRTKPPCRVLNRVLLLRLQHLGGTCCKSE